MTPTRAPIDVPLTLLAILTGLCSVLLVLVVLLLVVTLRRRRQGRPTAPPTARRGRWTGDFTPFAVGDPGRAATTVRPRPDPRSWDRRDTVLDGITLFCGGAATGELRAASVRGLAHANSGTVRQDEYAYRVTPDGRYAVLAIADGVSAGRHSDQAAMIVVRRGADLVAQHAEINGLLDVPWPAILAELAVRVTDRGRQLVAVGGGTGQAVPDREIADQLAATALFAVVDLVPGPDGCPMEIMALGDTSAWVLRAGSWEPQKPVKNAGAAIASSGTAAIPVLPATLDAPVRTTVRPGEALVLMSDGVGDALGAGRGDVASFLAEVWTQAPRTPLEFAAHVAFARKSFDDDRTVVALWPGATTSGRTI